MEDDDDDLTHKGREGYNRAEPPVPDPLTADVLDVPSIEKLTAGMDKTPEFYEALNEQVVDLIEEAIEHAQRDDRETLQEDDIPL